MPKGRSQRSGGGRAGLEAATVVVFAGGPPPGRHVLDAIPPGARILAADRGGRHALALGLRVELAVGDFDSIGTRGLAALDHGGARLERHPAEKDATDLELALGAALALAPRRILVVGGAGGRLDHLLGELLILAADTYAGVELDALLGRATVHVVRGERVLAGEVGELVSLLALNGPARGVVSDGLVYPLERETLAPGSGRGVSNLFAAKEARLALRSGVLLAVRPGRRASASAFRSALRSVREGSASS